MQLFAMTFTGKTVTLEVEEDATVEDVKFQLSDREGIPVDAVLLKLRGGTELKDGNTLASYGIKEGTQLSYVVR